MIRDAVLENENIEANSRDVQKLKELFPQCFDAAGNFSMETFKGILKDNVNLRDEGYELNFLGKSYARMLASLETTTVIQPDEEHNAKPENKDSKNIYISGDNLDALKHMLKSYEGAVKCIYIDPPYNTGSDGFIYKDKFTFTAESLMEKLNISESEAERLMSMTARGSASHSAWLTFMYPRLLLARDLLSKDGVIFISIDDNEQANLKLLCDSVFGEENFIANIIVQSNKRGQTYKKLAKTHEYLLLYSKYADVVINEIIKSGSNAFDKKDNIGEFEERELRNRNPKYGKFNRPNLYYPIFVAPQIVDECGYSPISLKKDDIFTEEILPLNSNNEESCWRWGKKKVSINNDINSSMDSEVVAKKKNTGEYGIYEKYRKSTYKSKTIWFEEFVGDLVDEEDDIWEENGVITEKGSKELKEYGMTDAFDFPKPVYLLKKIFEIGGFSDSLFLDFFSGSATSTEAIMSLNASDNGTRKIIAVQLPENLEEKYNKSSKTEKEKIKKAIDFLEGIFRKKTLDEVGQERIIRAAKKIREENPDTTADLGFKHYTLQDFDDSFIDKLDEWYEKLNSPQEILLDEKDHMLNRFGLSTVLTTYLVHDGYGFMPEVQELDLAGYTAYHCGKHLYLINEGFGEKQMKALYGALDTDDGFMAEHIVVFGYSFTFTASQMLRDNLFKVKDSAGINKTINIDVRY